VFDDINTELAEDEISDVTEGKELVSEEPEKDEINVDINTLTAQECKEKTVDVDFASNIWTNSIDTWNDVTLACAPILLEVSNETTQDVDTEKNSLDYSTYSSTYKLASTDCQTKDAASWDSLYKDLLSTFAPSSNIMDSVSSCQKAIATVEQGYSFEQAINSVNTMNEPFSDSPAVVKYW
ncbi:MAG: hypothetical protein U9Q20_02585, partial [Campylobacterota bacterium]|nr:hypothetical protein [Campylobacterota bacterium]